MKFLTGFLLCLGLLVHAGCGGSDDSGTSPTPQSTRIVVAQSATAPSLSNPGDAAWNAVTATNLAVSTTVTLKPSVTSVAAVPAQVSVKALINSDSLYLKFVWIDATHNVWREKYTVGATPPYFVADCCDDNAINREDQLFVMFAGLAGGGWDTWNWRSLTTDPGHLAEDMTFTDGLEADTVSNVGLTPAYRNVPPFGNQPYRMHKDGNAFEGNILYAEDAVDLDLLSYDWATGQTIPGWIIDTTIFSRQESIRLARWDIRAASTWDTVTQQYTVMMCRPLNTTYTDNLNMAALDSVKTRIGVLDNQMSLTTGGSSRGFTGDFWLIF